MTSERNRYLAASLCTVLSAVGFYFGSGLNPIWWLMWLAPIPVLWVATRLSLPAAFVVSFTAYAMGGLNMWHYLHGILQIPTGICISAVITPAVFFALCVALFRAHVLRGNFIWAVISFSAAWVVYEYVSYLLSPHGTYGSVAYTQMNFLPLLQLASLTGPWGITDALMLFAAAIAIAFTASSNHNSTKRAATIAAGVYLLGVIAFGLVRLAIPPSKSASTTTVGLIASDLRENLIAENKDDALRLLRDYAEQARVLASRGAQAVVIPEKLAVVTDAYIGEVDSIFGSVAKASHIWIVVGLVHPTAGAKWNEARIYSPAGTVAASYGKHHMLPPFESSFTIGKTRTLLPQTPGLWGVTICKDMDFPRLSREYGNDHAGLLLVPAWDFDADGWLHGRMAVLRGVESGFSIARAPKQGILTVTDNRGRVVAERDSDAAPFSTLVARVPTEHDTTLFARTGDWFAWLCLALLALSLADLANSRRRHPLATPDDVPKTDATRA